MQVVVFLSHVLQASHTFLQHLLLSYCFYYVFYIIIHYWLLIQQKKSLFFNGLAKKCTIMQKKCWYSFRNMQNENCCYGKTLSFRPSGSNAVLQTFSWDTASLKWRKKVFDDLTILWFSLGVTSFWVWHRLNSGSFQSAWETSDIMESAVGK